MKKIFFLISVIFITGCVISRKYIPAFEHEDFIRGDYAVISKSDIEISVRHCMGNPMKFEIIIANNTKEIFYFNIKYLVMLDEKDIQYNPMKIEEVSEYELFSESEDKRYIPVDVKSDNQFDSKSMALKMALNKIDYELKKEEMEKKRKRVISQLRETLIDNCEILVGAKKLGYIYFRQIDTETLTIVCGIDKEPLKFKFKLKR